MGAARYATLLFALCVIVGPCFSEISQLTFFNCVHNVTRRINCSANPYVYQDVATGVLPNCALPYYEPNVSNRTVKLLHPNIASTNNSVRPLAGNMSLFMQAPLGVDVVSSVQWTTEPLREFKEASPEGLREAWFLDPVLTADMADEPVSALQDLSRLVLQDQNLNWNGFGTFFRRYASVYDGKVVGLPVSAAIMLFYYRRDFFAQQNITVPATWEEVVDIAERYNGTNLGGSGGGAWGFCMSRQKQCYNGYTFQSVQVPFMQTMGTSQGFHFDPDTMKPLVNNTGTRRAAELYRRLSRYTAPTEQVACLPVSLAFVWGNCLMAVGTTLHFKYATFNNSLNTKNKTTPGTLVRGKTGTSILPGSMEVEDRTTGKLVRCNPDICPHGRNHTLANGTTVWINSAPFAGRGCFTYALNRHRHPTHQYMAYRLCARRLYAAVMWPSVLNPEIETTPVRSEMVDPANLGRYVDANYDAEDTLLFMKAVSETVEHNNIALNLRIDGAVNYYFAVDKASVALSDTNRDIDEILNTAQSEVEALYLNKSVDYLRRRYFRSIEHKLLEMENEKSQSTKVAIGVGTGVGGAVLLGLGVLAAVFVLQRRPSRFARAFTPFASPNITLVVTDMEGSTNLWEAFPAETMQEALQMHDGIARKLLARHNGYESATEGDSFITAFPDAMSALRFSLDFQAELMAADWPAVLLAESDICRPTFAVQRGAKEVQTHLTGRVGTHLPSAFSRAAFSSISHLARSSPNSSSFASHASGIPSAAQKPAAAPTARQPLAVVAAAAPDLLPEARTRSAAQLLGRPLSLPPAPASGTLVSGELMLADIADASSPAPGSQRPSKSAFWLGDLSASSAVSGGGSMWAALRRGQPQQFQTPPQSQQVRTESQQRLGAAARGSLPLAAIMRSSRNLTALTRLGYSPPDPTPDRCRSQSVLGPRTLPLDAMGGSSGAIVGRTPSDVPRRPAWGSPLTSDTCVQAPPRERAREARPVGASLELSKQQRPAAAEGPESKVSLPPTQAGEDVASGLISGLLVEDDTGVSTAASSALVTFTAAAARATTGGGGTAFVGGCETASTQTSASVSVLASALATHAPAHAPPDASLLTTAGMSVGGAGGIGGFAGARAGAAAGAAGGAAGAPPCGTWTFGAEASRAWQILDEPTAGAVTVFRGLRVRIGLHSGVLESELTRNLTSSRITFCGMAIRMGKAVSDAAHGGMVVLSDTAASQLLGTADAVAALAAESQEVWHLGRMNLDEDLRHVELFQVVTPSLAPRVAIHPGLRVKSVLLPGVTAAPAGNVALVRLHVAGLAQLRAENVELAGEVTRVLEALLLESLPAMGGYLSEAHSGGSEGIVVAFMDCLHAVAWALCVQTDMLYWDWSEDLLSHEFFEPIGVESHSVGACHTPGLSVSTTPTTGATPNEACSIRQRNEAAAAVLFASRGSHPESANPQLHLSSPPSASTPLIGARSSSMTTAPNPPPATTAKRLLAAQQSRTQLSQPQPQALPQSQPAWQLRQSPQKRPVAPSVSSRSVGIGTRPWVNPVTVPCSGTGSSFINLRQRYLLAPSARKMLLQELEGTSPSLLSPLQPPQQQEAFAAGGWTTLQVLMRRMRPSGMGSHGPAGTGMKQLSGVEVRASGADMKPSGWEVQKAFPQTEPKAAGGGREEGDAVGKSKPQGQLQDIAAAATYTQGPDLVAMAPVDALQTSEAPAVAAGMDAAIATGGEAEGKGEGETRAGTPETLVSAPLPLLSALEEVHITDGGEDCTNSDAGAAAPGYAADVLPIHGGVEGSTPCPAVRTASRTEMAPGELLPVPVPVPVPVRGLSRLGPGLVWGPGRVLLFRGPRTKATVEFGPVTTELCKTTGRLLYRGRLAKQLAKLTDSAQSGQVLCTPAVYAMSAAAAVACGITMTPINISGARRRGSAIRGTSSFRVGHQKPGGAAAGGGAAAAGGGSHAEENQGTSTASKRTVYLCSLALSPNRMSPPHEALRNEAVE